uniref:Uncharacterized protein n=1 Tax=Timema shepardi TaxID=629360 RepID=A0A7R9AW59_TIMSH|nr:unnamed protein product [Timema shepardi]
MSTYTLPLAVRHFRKYSGSEATSSINEPARFWERMLSQEHSENAWRNILSALEPMTTGHEIAEVSVFTMSLVLLAVSLTALLWDQL